MILDEIWGMGEFWKSNKIKEMKKMKNGRTYLIKVSYPSDEES